MTTPDDTTPGRQVTYGWTITGTDVYRRRWETLGAITALPGQFPDVCEQALRESFEQLTQGKAVFNHPGVGCVGPYRITGMLIELVEEEG